jgi:RNA polymerase sigma-70 factor (ECF subfamily)
MLPQRQREVLRSIAAVANSIKQTARKFAMSESVVRVASHHALSSLSAKLRD